MILKKYSFLFLALLSLNLIAKENIELKLQTLDSIAQMLVKNLDENKRLCNLSTKDSTNILSATQAKIDQLGNDFLDLTKNPQIAKWDQTCLKDCHCDFYLNLLDKKPEDKELKSIYEKISISAKKINLKNKNQCLEKAKKLCDSKLMKELKKDSKDFEVK